MKLVAPLKLKMPWPPTVNHCYATSFKTKVRFPSRDLKNFKAECKKLSIKHRTLIHNVAAETSKWVLEDCWVEVSMLLVMPYNKIFTKQGKVKKLDAANRIKPIHDALADLLGLDDCYFSVGDVEKVINDVDDERYVQIILKPQKIKNLSKIS